MKNLIFLFTANHSQLFIGKLILAVIFVLSGISHVEAQGYATTSIEISDFSLSPSVIDTTSSSQTVTATLRAKSPNIGISFISVHFRSHTGLQFLSVLIKSQHLISGNSHDGVYRVEAIFPQYSKAGTWRVFQITAFADRYYRNFYDSDLAERGFATHLQVISNDEDITPPEISDFTFTPTAVDTTNGTQNVTVTVRATDAKTGVRNVSVSFSRAGDDYLYPVQMNRISGNEKDGVYQGIIKFSQNTPSGTYNAHVFLADVLFNNKGFDNQALAARGFPSQLQVSRLEPTSVSISGRILSVNGRGISRAVVTLSDSKGSVRYAATNPFGYYQFSNVLVSETYNLEVKHKWYKFAPLVLFVDRELPNLNFTENNISEN